MAKVHIFLSLYVSRQQNNLKVLISAIKRRHDDEEVAIVYLVFSIGKQKSDMRFYGRKMKKRIENAGGRRNSIKRRDEIMKNG